MPFKFNRSRAIAGSSFGIGTNMSQASIRSYFSIVAIVGATIGLGWSQLEAQPVP